MTTEIYREVHLNQLRMDPENPRLPREHDWQSDGENQFLKEYVQRYNLIELARSITDKGFSPRHAEALLVVEDAPADVEDDGSSNGVGDALVGVAYDGSSDGVENTPADVAEGGSSDSDEDTPADVNYKVVEGNRRLATLKLLADPEARRAAGATNSEWSELAADTSKVDWDQIPIIIYPNERALDDYLGFRHITGPSSWRPEAKARFIAKLLSSGRTIRDVVKSIGSSYRTVRRYAEGDAVYSQALAAGIPMDRVEAGYGVFYNALDRQGIRNFIGLGPQSAINSLPDSPVPKDHLEQLRELIGLLFGDHASGAERVIRESRDLRNLGMVLENERARANLLRERDLERAWRISGGGRSDLLGLLSDLHLNLAQVNGQAREYAEDEEVREEVRRIYNLVVEMAERYGII